MVSWIAKALVQRGIGALPNRHYWNELFQKRVTHSLDLTDQRFEAGLHNCRSHLDQLVRFGSMPANGGFSAFELGTGWYPMVAIGFFLCGSREVWTWDIAPLLTRDRLRCTVHRFLQLEQDHRLQDHLQVMPERIDRLKEMMTLCDSPRRLATAELLDRLNIHYRTGSASRSGLLPQSIDLIVSDLALEYVSLEELPELLQEFRRIAAPSAVTSHTISLDDQYAASDPRITQFNFLRFPDWAWRCLNNPIIPLNRLRVSDYRRAFNSNGFHIVDEISQRGDPVELARTPLAARFRGYSIDDLLVVHTWLVAVPALPRT